MQMSEKNIILAALDASSDEELLAEAIQYYGAMYKLDGGVVE